MSCLSCVSDHQVEFPAEMIIHYSGRENLDKHGVWVFTNILVCLDCGFSSFTAPQAAAVLRGDEPAYPVAASEGIARRATA
jgi:hypothetical protein